jgi:hypothetical protein
MLHAIVESHALAVVGNVGHVASHPDSPAMPPPGRCACLPEPGVGCQPVATTCSTNLRNLPTVTSYRSSRNALTLAGTPASSAPQASEPQLAHPAPQAEHAQSSDAPIARPSVNAPPGTAIEAQQSSFWLGPQSFASPAQLGAVVPAPALPDAPELPEAPPVLVVPPPEVAPAEPALASGDPADPPAPATPAEPPVAPAASALPSCAAGGELSSLLHAIVTTAPSVALTRASRTRVRRKSMRIACRPRHSKRRLTAVALPEGSDL